MHSVIVKLRVHCNRPMYLSIPGTGFKLVELVFWILIVSGIPNCLSCIPYSKAQDSRFRIPQTKIPDSGIRNPYTLHFKLYDTYGTSVHNRHQLFDLLLFDSQELKCIKFRPVTT